MAFTGQLGIDASMLANIELGIGAGVVVPPVEPPVEPPPVVVPPGIPIIHLPLPELVSVGIGEIRPTRPPRGRSTVPLD